MQKRAVASPAMLLLLGVLTTKRDQHSAKWCAAKNIGALRRMFDTAPDNLETLGFDLKEGVETARSALRVVCALCPLKGCELSGR